MLGLLLSCIVLVSPSFATTPLKGTQPAQWRLLWKTDPATAATLSWSTDKKSDKNFVNLRKDGDEDTHRIECQRNGKYTQGKKKDPKLFYHHARLTDLQPATKYFVTMVSDGKRSKELYFTTAPNKDVPLSVIFGGDSRSDPETRRKVNIMIRKMVTESIKADRPNILAFVHGGDFILTGTNLAQWSVWMSDHELTTAEDGRLLPLVPARGNHDVGKQFNEIFDFPIGDENFYGINFSPQVRLVTLNSEAPTSGTQRKWLDKELKSSRKKNRWLLAQYHRPAFPAIKTPSMARIFWVPLFERYNVDLVCEADGHCIKRTAPIRRSKIDPTGVVYIGEGGLGVGQRTPDADRWFLKEPHGKVGSDHHVQLITFDKKEMVYRAILLDGKLFDEYHFKPRKK